MGLLDYMLTSFFYTPPPIVPSYILIEFIDWAKESFGCLPKSVNKASFQVQWTQDGIKESLFYRINDEFYVCEGVHKITIEKLRDYKKQSLAEHGVLTDEEYNILTSNESTELAKFIRDNGMIKVKSDVICDPFCVLLTKEE